MPDYRAYIVGADGHFRNAIEFEAPDDAHAVDQAVKYLDGHEVEVWQLERKVAVLKRTSE